MMADEIIIESEFHDAKDLEEALKQELVGENDIEIILRDQTATFRLEPIITVALIAGGAKVLSTLISALAAIHKSNDRAPKMIQVEDPSGIVLKVPATTTPDQVARLLMAANGRRPTRVVVLTA